MATDSMTIAKMQKFLEERKQLATAACAADHCVSIRHAEIDAMFLTPENSPPSVSSSASNSPYHSPYLECAPLTLPASPLKQEQTSPYNQAGSPYNQVGSPYNQAGSPYNQVGSPYNQMGSPPCDAHSPSPYAMSNGSPGAYSISSPEQGSPSALQYGPQYPVSMDGMDTFHPMVPFSTACTGATTCEASVYDPISQASVMYSTPPPPMYVNDTCSPHQLPPFQSVFDTQLERAEPYNSLESVQIKMVPNQYGISVIDYYPPTPPTPEDQLDMCGVPPPPPAHLCSFPTIPIRRKPKKPSKIVSIEVDDSDIKDIPTSAQLWEFTLRVLKKPKYNYMVSWENQKEGLFRFHNAQAFAAQRTGKIADDSTFSLV